MKPDWDKLAGTYADSKTVVIADVDCTADGKSLCEKHKVQGYPSIKYGEPESLKDFEGERDLASLEKFAADNLGPTCGPDNLDLCDETDKKFIAKFNKWDIDELDMSIEEKEAKIKIIDDAGKKVLGDLEKQLQALQSKIETEHKKKDDAIAKAKKDTGYGYMKAVKASRTPKVDPDHDADFDDEGEGVENTEEKKDEL